MSAVREWNALQAELALTSVTERELVGTTLLDGCDQRRRWRPLRGKDGVGLGTAFPLNK